jgi:hypothetical protein
MQKRPLQGRICGPIWAHFSAWEVEPRPYAGRIRPPLRLQSCLYWPGDGRGLLVLARRWTWKKNAKLPLWQLIPLSCHNGNLAHIHTHQAGLRRGARCGGSRWRQAAKTTGEQLGFFPPHRALEAASSNGQWPLHSANVRTERRRTGNALWLGKWLHQLRTPEALGLRSVHQW